MNTRFSINTPSTSALYDVVVAPDDGQSSEDGHWSGGGQLSTAVVLDITASLPYG